MGQLPLETGTEIYAFSLITHHAHVLLRSSPSGLPQYLRRLLTDAQFEGEKTSIASPEYSWIGSLLNDRNRGWLSVSDEGR